MIRDGAAEQGEGLEATFERCRAVVEDLSFPTVREHKAKGGKALGCFPVYSPFELIRAAGFLPVGLSGGGNQLDISLADSRFGSFICSIVKSTTELAMKGMLDPFDGLLFQDICDSARNLAWVTKRNLPEGRFMEYLHLPQRAGNASVSRFLAAEYQRLLESLERRGGVRATEERLRESVRLFNENRELLARLYRLRSERPQDLATHELYLLMRAGNLIDVSEHNRLLASALPRLSRRGRRVRDGVRVVVEGAFCEQPPLELLELLDATGCFVVDDDLLLGRRWLLEPTPEDGDVVAALAESYWRRAVCSSVRHETKVARTRALVEKVRRSGAQAVIFLYAKFCEPGLFDYVLFKKAVEEAGIPHLLIEFEEKAWTFEKTRMELETFVESLLLEYA